MNKNYILGLDIGTSSVGWSLLDKKGDESYELLDIGIRIFQEPRDSQTKELLNQSRREKRGQRRGYSRKKEKLKILQNLLQKSNLLPKEYLTDFLLKNNNPYLLRKKGLYEKLEFFEIGRIFYHLGQRRGFLSNRKTPLKKDDKGIYGEFSILEKEMKENNIKTLGEYFFEKLEKGEKIRSIHTKREMFEYEFESIWKKQKEYYNKELSDDLKDKLWKILFFQRPLKSQKHLIGNCTFFENRKRVNKNNLWAQEFKIWQDINNLRYQDRETNTWYPLSLNQRKIIVESLLKQKEITFGKIRKLLKFPEDTPINLETRTKQKLQGSSTNASLYKILGEKWEKLDRKEKDLLVKDLLDIELEKSLRKSLNKKKVFTQEEVDELMKLDISTGKYLHLSEKAIKKVLPLLQEKTKEVTLKTGEIIEAPYSYKEVIDFLELKEKDSYGVVKDIWRELPNFRNPSVTKALVEVRKIIKGLKSKYGIPGVIKIELARDIKNSQEKIKEIDRKNLENQKENERVKSIISEIPGVNIEDSQDVLKYKLWEESKGLCPYTGKSIEILDLYNGTVDIEHIIPYSRSLDDSYMNKTLCYADFNRNEKKNYTPFEIFSGNLERYEEVKQRIKILPWKKQRRFSQEIIEKDGFFNQQLNDTQYISREVVFFLKNLLGANIQIEVTKGQLTAKIRRSWGWNRFINETLSNEKNRDDHRHHAIDATVIALTTRGLLQKISNLSVRDKMDRVEHFIAKVNPGKDFSQSLEKKLKEVYISFTPSHKIKGAFHAETGFGYIGEDETKKGRGLFVIRKALNKDFNNKKAELIRDESLRKIVLKHLEKYNNDPKLAFSETNWTLFHKDGKTPIKSVRIVESKSFESCYNYKNQGNLFFEYGSNHHVEILENKEEKNKDGTYKRVGIFVTTYEAAQRAKDKKPIVQRVGPWRYSSGKEYSDKDWKFIYSLMKNDIMDFEGKGIYRVQKMSGANNQIFFIPHYSSNLKDGSFGLVSGKIYGKKINISPIGIKYIAND